VKPFSSIWRQKACTSHSKYGKVLPFPLHKLIDNQQISVILYNHKKFQAGVYMKLVVVVLSEDSRLQALLQGLVENGIKGATIISSQGLARALEDAEDYSFLGSIKAFLDPQQYGSTVFSVIQDNQVELVSKAIKQTVGDLSQPDMGIMFTIPVDYVEGIRFD
jgi:nitrogen regulatory protein PII